MRRTPAIRAGGIVGGAPAVLELSVLALLFTGRGAPLYHVVDRLYFLFHTRLLLVDHVLLRGAAPRLILQLLLQLRVIHGIVFLLLALVLLRDLVELDDGLRLIYLEYMRFVASISLCHGRI